MMALDDVTVIDLSHALAGPFASTILADYGARVVKIEPNNSNPVGVCNISTDYTTLKGTGARMCPKGNAGIQALYDPDRVQRVLRERGVRKPRKVKHSFAFNNLIRCGHCGCALVGEITFVHPQLNFVAGTSEKNSQTGVDKSWQETVKDLFPLRINKVEVSQGEIHYQDTNHQPPIDIYISHLEAVATNLTNSKDISDNLYAVIEAKPHMDMYGDSGLTQWQPELNVPTTPGLGFDPDPAFLERYRQDS